MTFFLQEDVLSHRGHMHGHLGAILASLGGVLGASWPDVGPFGGHSGVGKWRFRSGGVHKMGKLTM